MRRTVILLILVLLSVIGVQTTAQDKPQDQKAMPSASTPTSATDTNELKNEVEQMLAEAKKNGDVILGTCLENCGDKPKQITEGFEGGRALVLAKPAYSPLARAAHVSGTVEVQVIIDEDGKVIRAAAISGHPLLQAACVEAARNSEFTPSKLEGKAVKVVGVLQYNFVAQ
jgi:TonB family protein